MMPSQMLGADLGREGIRSESSSLAMRKNRLLQQQQQQQQSPVPATSTENNIKHSRKASSNSGNNKKNQGGGGGVYVDKPILRGQFHKFGALLYLPLFGLPLYLHAKRNNPEHVFTTVLFNIAVESIMVVSATLHTYPWKTNKWYLIARRLDFVTIFVGIALLYSSLGKLLFGTHGSYVVIERLVWVCAMVGAFTKCFIPEAPNWLNASVFLVQGWSCAPLIPTLFRTAALEEALGLCAGGIFVTMGALAYGFQWPQPSPRHRPQREIVFGPHELFHVGTLFMFASFWYTMRMLVARVGVAPMD